MAGYSTKSLSQKLGIKNNFFLLILNAPENYYQQDLYDLSPEINIKSELTGQFDFIQFFTIEQNELIITLQKLKSHLKQNGMIWISWPKKASKIKTDLNEDIIRKIALNCGLVDIKVCAVNEIWSGLKLVIPVKDRK